jgi:hypothetical protein
MKKYFITNRPSGLGDLLCNLAATYYYARMYDGDVILDWRNIIYNYNEFWKTKKTNTGNLFTSLFVQPTQPLNGVNFILPEVDDVYWNIDRSKIFNINPRWNKISDELNQQEYETINKNINDNEYIFVEQRIHEHNQIFPNIQHSKFSIEGKISNFTEKFDYVNFLNFFQVQPYIKYKIDNFIKDNFVSQNVVGIHMRYGNIKQKEPTIREYKNDTDHWISDKEIIDTIKEKISNISIENPKYFISCDDHRINSLILDNIPNSFCLQKYFPEDGLSLMGTYANAQIKILQESFMDMFLLSECQHLIYTYHSVYTVWPIYKIIQKYESKASMQSMFTKD